jgi:type IV pilus assembly protein PilQ
MNTSRQATKSYSRVLGMALALLMGTAVALAGPTARLVRVEASVDAGSVRIEAQASGAFDFTTYRPSEKLFVLDMAGVTPQGGTVASGARVLKSELVSSYRVIPYRGGERSIVRLEILLRTPAEPRVERQGPGHVAIIFGETAAAQNKQSVSPQPAQPSGASDRVATSIEAVEVRQAGEKTEVRIAGDGRLSCEVMRLTNPDRVVVDFEGLRARVAARQITSALQPVRSVRVGTPKNNITRVVIDLDSNEPHHVRASGPMVTVQFNSSAQAQARPSISAPAAEPAQPAQAEPAKTEVAAEQKAAETQQNVELPAEQIKLPDTMTKPGAALPIQSQEAKLTPAAATSAPAVAAPSLPAAMPGPMPSSQPRGPQAAGEPISVNLKDVDLKDFFRLIHEISGLNVVLDPNVRGTVTLVLDDVPWNQALDIVLRNNGLDKQVEGNVLRIATRDTLKREAEQRRDLQKAQAEAVDQVVTTRVLSYAKATTMRDTLKRFLSSRGEILADERSNTLIIRDIPSVLPELDNLIKQLDRRGQQVEIEARVVAATRAFAREIGTQFGFATTSTSGRSVYGGLVGNTSFNSPISRGPGLPAPPLVASGTQSIPLNTNLGAVAPTSGFSFAHSSPNLALDFIISAAESKGVGKLLSKPKVITQNNVKATIKQGNKIPVQTNINQTISVQFIDALLKLEVTPQIAAEGTVFMEVVVDNTAIDRGVPAIDGIPALVTQSAETSVLINDGGTVVIGGVIVAQQSTDVVQVPLLGSIPIIGHLFKRTTVRTSSQELLFFITPRIVPI